MCVHKWLCLLGAHRELSICDAVLFECTRPSEPRLFVSQWEQHRVKRRRKPLSHRESPHLNLKKYQEPLVLCIIENWFCSENVLSTYYMLGSGTQLLYSLTEGTLLQPGCYSLAGILISFSPHGHGGGVECAYHPIGRRQTSSHSGKVGTFPLMLFSHLEKAKMPEANCSPHFSSVHCCKLVVHLFPLLPG